VFLAQFGNFVRKVIEYFTIFTCKGELRIQSKSIRSSTTDDRNSDLRYRYYWNKKKYSRFITGLKLTMHVSRNGTENIHLILGDVITELFRQPEVLRWNSWTSI
jgi:hypothetical protein